MTTEELEQHVAELERTVESLSRILASHWHHRVDGTAFVTLRTGRDETGFSVAEVMAHPDMAEQVIGPGGPRS